LITQANLLRHLRALRFGQVYLPPVRQAALLRAILSKSGPFWFGAGAVTAALIIFGAVGQRKDVPAPAPAATFDVNRSQSVIYREPDQRQSFAERWGGMVATTNTPKVADPTSTSSFVKSTPMIRSARASAQAETGLAMAYASATPSQGFSLAALHSAPVNVDIAESDEERKALAKMDEVERYLWEVYKRRPIKSDNSGDFTWKDPAAAKRFGVSMPAYVISGMDKDFREQLYHMGKAMDGAGIRWAILSAFRDDYRQSIASGFKASARNSLHGGSARTGGYGHGRAVDVTGAEDNAEQVWKWIDANGKKYGLHRPMRAGDPPHVQSMGDWRKLAQGLREARIRIAQAQGDKVAAKQVQTDKVAAKEVVKGKVANAAAR
jgi:hypothetical protein